MKVILVSVGNLQKYIFECIKQLHLFHHDVVVITDKQFVSEFDSFDNVEVIEHESLVTKFDESKFKFCKRFRSGFWHHTSRRLFLVYSYMETYNVKNIIHIENDVLIYSDLKFDYDNYMRVTLDHPTRVVPGIIYIPTSNHLQPLIEEYNYSKHDMDNVAIFYNKYKNDLVKTFPIIFDNTINNEIDNQISDSSYNNDFKLFNGIFDAAAMGQYIGGADPRNGAKYGVGFVNETCLVKYNKYKFIWKENDSNVKLPYLLDKNNNYVKIHNLHIHCKDLAKFVSY